MQALIGKWNVPFVIMHIQGQTRKHAKKTIYDDVVEEINYFFENQIKTFQKHGASKFIIDPGFGFGKTMNIIIPCLIIFNAFCGTFEYPVLAGISQEVDDQQGPWDQSG